jgi:hypothetical protein
MRHARRSLDDNVGEGVESGCVERSLQQAAVFVPPGTVGCEQPIAKHCSHLD